MREIPIYRAEADIADAIRCSGSITLACALEPARPFEVSQQILARWQERAVGVNLDQPDLHYLTSILVSSGWNRNDDVFIVPELWVARRTPEDKPFNLEHDCAQIIGHITGNSVIDAEGSPVADHTPLDEVPDRIHIVTHSVLYAFWAREDLQKRMDALLAEIARGEWFVSMECLLADFDYAVLESDGTQRIIARNEETAFLSKHLRAYNGDGTYEGCRLGRIPRDFVFSGKGLVRRPANPDSVILSLAHEFCARRVEPGYAQLTPTKTRVELEKKTTMSQPTLEQQLASLREENERLKNSLREGDLNKVREELAQSRAALEESVGRNTQLAQELSEVRRNLEEAEKVNASLRAELEQEQARRLRQERIGIAAEKLKTRPDQVEGIVDATIAMTPEQFERHLDVILAVVTRSQPQAGNTPQGSTPTNTPPPSTPASSPPAATSLPAPQGVRAHVGDTEVDPAETVADPTLVDRTQTPEHPALATAGCTDAEALRREIAQFFSLSEK